MIVFWTIFFSSSSIQWSRFPNPNSNYSDSFPTEVLFLFACKFICDPHFYGVLTARAQVVRELTDQLITLVNQFTIKVMDVSTLLHNSRGSQSVPSPAD